MQKSFDAPDPREASPQRDLHAAALNGRQGGLAQADSEMGPGASPPRSRGASRGASPRHSRGTTPRASVENTGGVPPVLVKPVEMTLKLALDFSAAGQPESPQRIAFNNNLTQDLSNAAGLAPDLFEVVSVSPGSIIVQTLIHPDPADRGLNPLLVAAELEKQADQPHSPLHSGVLTRHLEGIALPTVRPGSLDKLLAGPAPPQAPNSSQAPRSPQAPSSPRSPAAVPHSKTAPDDAQLAALKAKLNRYKQQLEEAPPAQATRQRPVSPRPSPAAAPARPKSPPQMPTQVTPSRSREPYVPTILSPPIATVLEDAVVPASTLPVYEQKAQNSGDAVRKPGSNQASFYNAGSLPPAQLATNARRDQELAAMDTRMSNLGLHPSTGSSAYGAPPRVNMSPPGPVLCPLSCALCWRCVGLSACAWRQCFLSRSVALRRRGWAQSGVHKR